MSACSVLVPAHQEESVIARCLDALAPQLPVGSQVVVVANGCTDATAQTARAHPSRPQVLELAVGSKHAALNAGDAALTAYPRLYVDADVVLSPGSVARLLDVLSGGEVHAASPRPVFRVEGRPWPVRAHYRTWERLPYLREDPIGNGVYALSHRGRERFGVFPPLIADDLFVQRHFTRAERRCLEDATFLVEAPRRTRDLVGVRTRAYLGARQLHAHSPRQDDDPDRTSAIGTLLRDRHTRVDALSYAAIGAVATGRAALRWRRGDTQTWDRDGSTR